MTPSFKASAMRGTCVMRAAFIAALASFPATAAAQRPAPLGPGAALPPAPARWDTLYHANRIFELRDVVAATTTSAVSASVQFYRGIVAHAFNDNDGTIRTLAPLVNALTTSLTSAQLGDAVGALADSYGRVFRYREAAQVYRKALLDRKPTLPTALRATFEDRASVMERIADVPPQRISWSASSSGIAVANDSVMFGMAASINGDATAIPLGVEPGARLSIVDSTTAARHGIQILNGSVRSTFVGHPVTAKIGVIRSLTIGPAALANVVVLVIPDDSLRTTYSGSRVRGVLGNSVLSALGRVTFTRGGQIALSSPGTDRDSALNANMAFVRDGTAIEAMYGSQRLALLFEPTAPQTLLSPQFLERFPAASASATRSTYVGRTPGGSVISIPAYVLSGITISVAGRSVRLTSVNALTHASDARSDRYAGTLGQDALRTADRVTLDFGAMTARFRDAPPAAVLPQIVYPSAPAAADTPVGKVPGDIAFVALLFALFVIPKALQRYRLPSAITSLLMGAGATAFGLFHNDPTLHLLSTFGIVALFLFAGLEIDGHELRRQASPLLLHGLVWSILLAIGALIATQVFGFAGRPSVLIALALLTPSTGFILSSLAGFGLHEKERFSVKTYAIASELLALLVLFFVLQSTSVGRLAFAVAAMAGVVIIIPFAFRMFARIVAPHAPRSEFAFLLMVAIVCAYATTRLGVYYLVGAFLVGIAAQRFRSELPAMSSEKMVDALESFGSVFIPFYFFHAGTQIVREQLTVKAIVVGITLVVLLIPLRVGITMLQRHHALHDEVAAARRIGVALIPTLVFTLVIADILNTTFDTPKYVLGALVLYTVINTTIPAFALHSAPPEFENVEAAEV